MRDISRDLMLAWRRLASAPAFTLFAILTLTLGIGATTAIYSVVHAVLLKGPAYPDADRVARLYHIDPRRGGSGPMRNLSTPDFEDYRQAQTSFSALAAWARFRHTLVTEDGAELLVGEMVGGGYFEVVGVRAAIGRTIQPSDDRPDAPNVIVLSDGLWRRRFGADPGVIGRVVSLGGDPFEVIGVMPRWFGGVDMPNLMPTPAWTPLSSTRPTNRWDVTDREHRWLHVIGRLKSDRTVRQAQVEFRAIGERLDAEHPIGRGTPGEYRARFEQQRQWFLMPAAEVRMHESVDPLAKPLAATTMIAVGLVLLVACTNLANLMLARGSARRHENAVRLALGAPRWRLVREHLAEAALVTGAGALASLVVARFVMVKLLSTTIDVPPSIIIQVDPRMNAPVVGIAMLSTVICVLVFGLIPAWHNTRASVRDALASDGHAAPQRWRGRRNLIAVQVAISGGLVAVAALCAQQAIETAGHDPGFDLDRLAFARVDFKMQKKEEAYARTVLERAMRDARLQPGVESVALASGLPVGITSSPDASVALNADTLQDGLLLGAPAHVLTSTPSIFEVLGVQIVAGRGLDERDTAGSAPVAVINSSLASKLFGQTSPVGRTLVFQIRPFLGEEIPPVQTATIVGLAKDTDVGSLGRRGGWALYLPFTQHYSPAMSVLTRASSDPAALPASLRWIFNRIDPELAVLEASTGTEIVGAATMVVRVGAATAGLLGGLALLLAMVGLYGVISDLVSRRTREIGVRVALGADPARLTWMVLRDAVRPVVLGLLVAIALGAVARMAFRPLFLRMMPAFDPMILVLVPVGFVAAAVLASYLPARRAARVDPNVALRHL
jgi:predicted permease